MGRFSLSVVDIFIETRVRRVFNRRCLVRSNPWLRLLCERQLLNKGRENADVGIYGGAEKKKSHKFSVIFAASTAAIF